MESHNQCNDIIAYHGDRSGNYTFDKQRICRRDDGIRGFYFAPLYRKWVADMYTSDDYEEPHKYVLHIKNPIYEERPFGRRLTPADCKAHDALIAVSGTAKIFPNEPNIHKGDIIEIVVFDKNIIEELTD